MTPDVEAFTLICYGEFLELAMQYDALTVRIQRPGFSHVIFAMLIITDKKVDEFSKIWLWLHSDKVIMSMNAELLIMDIEPFLLIEDNPYCQ